MQNIQRKRIKTVLSLLFTVLTLLTASDDLTAGEKIGALGRIKPGGTGDGIISLGGPPGDTISIIQVKENDYVKKGTILVIFESKKINEMQVALSRIALKEAVEMGRKKITFQELKIKEIESLGNKTSELQKLKIIAAKQEYDYALTRFERFNQIGKDSFSDKEVKEGAYKLKTTRINFDQAEKEQERLSLNMENDLVIARKELERLIQENELNVFRAEKQLEINKTRLSQSILSAPTDGTILEIFQTEGETTGSTAIMNMASLKQMYVIGEVYESDLLKLSPGLKATVTSKALPAPITGTIEAIIRIINPITKTATIKIRLNESETAAKLINLEVNISIEP